MMELAKTRAFDKLFFDTGVEEEDILQAFYDHKIAQTSEFKQIIADCRQLAEKKLQELLNKAAGMPVPKKAPKASDATKVPVA